MNDLFGWWRGADVYARRALVAGLFGWMLDAFDVMLFALVLPSVSADLGLTKAQADSSAPRCSSPLRSAASASAGLPIASDAREP